ncbi:MAG: FAD-dependent monooxygenase [Candidatus Omnitrophica bacterium]|nr:FAD-dependent monooxygenase [Candidatus Omnitrophota bacterium]
MSHYDAVVIGAGPAGIASALELAMADWKVLLIDKSAFPRDKVCGGFIGPENKEILNEYGIMDDVMRQGAQPVRYIHISATNGVSVRVPLCYNGRPDYGLGISRRAFDQIFLDRARGEGVEFLAKATARDIIHRGGHSTFTLVRLDTGEKTAMSANHIIHAHGGSVKSRRPASRLFGVSCLFDRINGTDAEVIMHFIDQGHAGINRFEDGTVNVCYVIKESLFKRYQGSFEKIWDHMLDANPNLSRQMRAGRPLTRWQGTFVDMARPSRFFDGNAFYVGDAASLIHPVAGGGITLALSGGILLGSLLGQDYPQDVSRATVAAAYARAFRRRYALPIRASRMIGALGHHNQASRTVIRLLKWREGDLHQLFSLFHQPAVLQA